jgi:hypothetical protein
LFPQKCLVFTNVIIKNTDHLEHKDKNNKQYINGNNIVKKFSELIKDKKNKNEFLSWIFQRNFVRENNKLIYSNKIDKLPIEFNNDMLKKIINIP